jgi:hypothetical protein
MSRRVLARVLLTGVVALVGAACDSTTSQTSFDLAEFSITGPGFLAPDTELITVDNAGEFPHTLVITDASGSVVAATDLIQAGETSELAVELSEGVYSFTCRIVIEGDDGQLIDHFEAGMHMSVNVVG